MGLTPTFKRAGEACRLCGGKLNSEMRGIPPKLIRLCPTCDAPIEGDNTVLNFDDEALDRLIEEKNAKPRRHRSSANPRTGGVSDPGGTVA